MPDSINTTSRSAQSLSAESSGRLRQEPVRVNFNTAVSGSSPLGSVPPAQLAGSAVVRLSALGRLQQALDDLQSTLSGIDSADKVARLSSASSNDAIVARLDASIETATSKTDDASEKLPATARIEVSQRAQAQRLQSGLFADENASAVGAGSLAVQFGRFSEQGNFLADGRGERIVNIFSGGNTLGGIARAINISGGLAANVIRDGGQFRLQLQGQEGAARAFRITVDDADGSDTDVVQGLSRLAFLPSEPVNLGRNLSVTQNAQDARLTVDGKLFSGSSNQFSGAIAGATLAFNATGNATLTFGRDADHALVSARPLVAALNTYRETTRPVAGILSNRLDAAIEQTVDLAKGGEANLTLQQLGINRSRDGRLSLDETRFQAQFKADTRTSADLIGQTAAAVSDAVTTIVDASNLNASLGNRISLLIDPSLAGNSQSIQSLARTTNASVIAQYYKISGLS